MAVSHCEICCAIYPVDIILAVPESYFCAEDGEEHTFLLLRPHRSFLHPFFRPFTGLSTALVRFIAQMSLSFDST